MKSTVRKKGKKEDCFMFFINALTRRRRQYKLKTSDRFFFVFFSFTAATALEEIKENSFQMTTLIMN